MPKIKVTTLVYIAVIVLAVLQLRSCFCGKKDTNSETLSTLTKSLEATKKAAAKDKKESDSVIAKKNSDFKLLQQKDSALTANRASLLSQLYVWTNRSKSRLAIIEQLKNKKDTSGLLVACDSIQQEYEGYVSIVEVERKIVDSLLTVKDSMILAKDALAKYNFEKLLACRRFLDASFEVGGAFMQAAIKNKPRNLVSVLGATQFNSQLNGWAVGGGLSFKNKRDYTMSGLFLLDNNTNKVFQVQLSYPIKLRKR